MKITLALFCAACILTSCASTPRPLTQREMDYRECERRTSSVVAYALIPFAGYGVAASCMRAKGYTPENLQTRHD